MEAFVLFTYSTFGGEIYRDKNEKLYIVFMNNVFDETKHIGQYNDNMARLTKEEIDLLKNEGEPSIDHMVSFLSLMELDALTKALKLSGSSLIKIVERPKINLIKYKEEEKILLLVDGFDRSLEEVEKIYISLSKAGLTPTVHNSGRFDCHGINFLYLITDYIPLTLSKIEDKQLKNELLKKALAIIKFIHKMGFINQDLHGENFLYDDMNNKLYAIDFTEVKIDTDINDELTILMHLEDINKIVTEEQIMNGIY